MGALVVRTSERCVGWCCCWAGVVLWPACCTTRASSSGLSTVRAILLWCCQWLRQFERAGCPVVRLLWEMLFRLWGDPWPDYLRCARAADHGIAHPCVVSMRTFPLRSAGCRSAEPALTD